MNTAEINYSANYSWSRACRGALDSFSSIVSIPGSYESPNISTRFQHTELNDRHEPSRRTNANRNALLWSSETRLTFR